MTQIWHWEPKEEEGQTESHIKQLTKKRLRGVLNLSFFEPFTNPYRWESTAVKQHQNSNLLLSPSPPLTNLPLPNMNCRIWDRAMGRPILDRLGTWSFSIWKSCQNTHRLITNKLRDWLCPGEIACTSMMIKTVP